MDSMVSVIIPVYNVEKYIVECFESLLSQTYQNFEALLVDDGSTDRSGSICDEYAQKDARFKVWHTENRGIGATRNFAMERMTGDYCFFLDPDDVIETDTLFHLKTILETYHTDIAIGEIHSFGGKYAPYQSGEEKIGAFWGHDEICRKLIFEKNDLKPLKRKSEKQSANYAHVTCLYKTAIMRNNGIAFLPISYGEDTYVCFKYLLVANSAVLSNQVVYSYRKNPTSTTFQYHPNYLSETKDYYRFYLDLFETYAPEYVQQAKEGLDGQYLRRCLSAIERELLMSPKSRTAREMIATVRQIRRDEKFCKLFTWGNLKYTSRGWMRWMLVSIKLGMYPIVIAVFVLAYKRRKK